MNIDLPLAPGVGQTDTICAPCTQSGGAITVVRVSGPQAVACVDSIFASPKGLPLAERKSHTIAFGRILDDKREVVDEVVVSLFRGPQSYTGEDVVEISCHGSRYILHTVLDLLVNNGCRMALPGEFTQRAFLNGKMDLSQAEAVADLIASDSSASHRIAMNQMRGNFSKQLKVLRDQLLHLTSLMELELDFSDHEELEFADRSQLLDISNEVYRTISKLANSFKLGNALKNGVPVAIIGETNAGKSTLLNSLLGDEKAIVSDVHGTTRDVIEDTINLRGVTFRFIDTAGIRHTDDPVESIGIARSYQKMEQAEIILWVIGDAKAHNADLQQKVTGDGDTFADLQQKVTDEVNTLADLQQKATGDVNTLADLQQKVMEVAEDKKVVLLFNKSDILTEAERTALTEQYANIGIPHLFISAKCGEGMPELEETLLQIADLPQCSSEDIIVTNLRHYEALISALDAVERVQMGMQSGLSGDFISQDLRECIHHLSDIVGEVSTDSVLQNIFKHFCIGK